MSELIGLKLSDVNFGKGEFKVFGKGSKERLVPLGEAARRALIRYIEQARPDAVKPNDEQVLLTGAVCHALFLWGRFNRTWIPCLNTIPIFLEEIFHKTTSNSRYELVWLGVEPWTGKNEVIEGGFDEKL